VHVIRAGHNRIDAVSAARFFSALVRGKCQLEVLNLSHNQITAPAMQAFSSFLKLGHLIEMDLSRNMIRGTGMEALCEGIRSQTALSKLDLSANPLGETGIVELAKLLSPKGGGGSLAALGLGWTEMSGQHGAAFLNAMAANRTLKILDLSFNTLGGTISGRSCAKALGTMFSKNRSLTHLDLSYNHIGPEDTALLAEAIKPNHVLAGLHFGGNEGGWVDSRGFIQDSAAHPLPRPSPAKTPLKSTPGSKKKGGVNSPIPPLSHLPLTPTKDVKSNTLALGEVRASERASGSGATFERS
jgi:Ran GTPase-activating protein (RanGAP) involved in mRNA processing and transport